MFTTNIAYINNTNHPAINLANLIQTWSVSADQHSSIALATTCSVITMLKEHHQTLSDDVKNIVKNILITTSTLLEKHIELIDQANTHHISSSTICDSTSVQRLATLLIFQKNNVVFEKISEFAGNSITTCSRLTKEHRQRAQDLIITKPKLFRAHLINTMLHNDTKFRFFPKMIECFTEENRAKITKFDFRSVSNQNGFVNDLQYFMKNYLILMFPNIQEFYFSLTDSMAVHIIEKSFIMAIINWKSLRTLHLVHCSKNSNDTWEKIRFPETLESVIFGPVLKEEYYGTESEDYHPGITDADLHSLSLCRRIHTLVILGAMDITGNGLNALRLLVELEILELHHCYSLVDTDLKKISPFIKLRKLCLTNSTFMNEDTSYNTLNFTGIGFQQLMNFKYMEELDLSNYFNETNINDEGIGCLAMAFPNLTALYLNGCRNITNIGIVHLCKLKNLTKLSMEDTILTEAMTKNIAAFFPNLLEFTFGRADMILDSPSTCDDDTRAQLRNTDQTIINLQPLQQLKKLSLRDTYITNRGITNLIHSFPNLIELDLIKCDSITNKNIFNFKSLKQLEKLSVDHDFVTANNVSNFISCFPQLSGLSLGLMRVEDVAKCIKDLEPLKKLKVLTLSSYTSNGSLDSISTIRKEIILAIKLLKQLELFSLKRWCDRQLSTEIMKDKDLQGLQMKFSYDSEY